MARQQRKSSTHSRKKRPEHAEKPRDSAREQLRRSFPRPERSAAGAPPAATAPKTLLAALAKQKEGATAAQLAAAIGRDGEGRVLAEELRRLVEQGQVMEQRPGRYQVSGSGGEFSAVLEADEEAPAPPDGEAPAPARARLPDGRVLPLNLRYALNTKAGDVVQVAIGEDGQALVTRILRRSGREVVGVVQFRPGGPVLIPDNRKEGQLPVLSAFTRFHDQYHAGDRVVGQIAIDPAGRAGVHLTRILGPETPEITDFRYVALTHDLPGEFPREVEQQANAYRADHALTGKGQVAREDLRERLVFTSNT